MNLIESDSSEDKKEGADTQVEPVTKAGRSRKRNIVVFAVVVTLNIALLVVIGSQLLTPAANPATQSSTGAGGAGGNATLTAGEINSPLIGKPAPDFTLPQLNNSGQNLRLADFKGKPVILNFWASWCDPCKEEAPLLQKAWLDLQKQDVVLIGIDGQEPASKGMQFLQKYGITYPNVQDTARGTTAVDYGVTGLPETVFINRNGVVVAKWIAPLSEQALQYEVAKILR
ncbi:MAG: TlpA family protein disulfide reductase [Ktedonobacteraceae bacterium]|nr:TlpA family protein disulfide reductase [Ktedonobacteraceae bacterium]